MLFQFVLVLSVESLELRANVGVTIDVQLEVFLELFQRVTISLLDETGVLADELGQGELYLLGVCLNALTALKVPLYAFVVCVVEVCSSRSVLRRADS